MAEEKAGSGRSSCAGALQTLTACPGEKRHAPRRQDPVSIMGNLRFSPNSRFPDYAKQGVEGPCVNLKEPGCVFENHRNPKSLLFWQ